MFGGHSLAIFLQGDPGFFQLAVIDIAGGRKGYGHVREVMGDREPVIGCQAHIAPAEIIVPSHLAQVHGVAFQHIADLLHGGARLAELHIGGCRGKVGRGHGGAAHGVFSASDPCAFDFGAWCGEVDFLAVVGIVRRELDAVIRFDSDGGDSQGFIVAGGVDVFNVDAVVSRRAADRNIRLECRIKGRV